MGSINVLVYYNGKWDQSRCYNDYSMVGIVVPLDCSYVTLVGIILNELKMDVSRYCITVQYQVIANGPLMQIDTDSSLYFYIQVKKGETNLTKFPLCVDIEKLNTIENNLGFLCNSIDVGDAGSFHDRTVNDHTRFGLIENMLITNFPTIQEMGDDICENATYGDNNIEDSGTNVISRPSIEDVKQDSIFQNKDLLTTSVALYAINDRFQYTVYKSDKNEYVLKCLDANCNWRFRASVVGKTTLFKIRSIKNSHTCSLDVVLGDHRQATCSVIANCIKHKFTSAKTVYTPADIVRDMMKTYGVTISYEKAWRSRERALEIVRGDPEISYGGMPSYLHMLRKLNPGSYTKIETDENDKYMFSFVALGASIYGWNHCKPIIVVDGTFLTGNYGGTLFTACTQDANDNIFILAYGVGDSENNTSWEWFMLRLKEAYGDRDGLVIISDRHGAIENAIAEVYPNALHGVCSYHLFQNLKKRFGKKSKFIRQPFNAAVRAYTISEFDIQMRHLDTIDEDIRGYLEKVGYHKWTRARMTSNRFSTMTSNIVESVNSVTRSAKNFPIEALFESLRCTVQKWFFKNLNDARSTFTRLGSRYECMMRERSQESIRMEVIPSSDSTYQVNDETTAYLVRLDENTCSCRRFQIDEMPCPHAIAVINKKNLSVYDFCSPYFSKESYINTYTGTISPIVHKSEWSVPDEVSNIVVLAPDTKRRSGRPNENRKRSVYESRKKSKCGRCSGYGHNRSKCKNPAPLKTNKMKKHNANNIINGEERDIERVRA